MSNRKQTDEEKIRELSRNIQIDEEKRRLQEDRQKEKRRIQEEKTQIEKTRLKIMENEKRNNKKEKLTKQLSNIDKSKSKIQKTGKMFRNKEEPKNKTRKLIPNFWARKKRNEMEDVYNIPQQYKLKSNQKSVIPGVGSPNIGSPNIGSPNIGSPNIPVQNIDEDEMKNEEETNDKMFLERNPLLNRDLQIPFENPESIYSSSKKSSKKSSTKGSSDIDSSDIGSTKSSSDISSSTDFLENDDNYKNLGFNETIKYKPGVKTSVPVKTNICSNILNNGLKVNSKYYFPSEFPNITRNKSVSLKTISKKGGKKNKYKTKKYRY
jgi:hypothetical protein